MANAIFQAQDEESQQRAVVQEPEPVAWGATEGQEQRFVAFLAVFLLVSPLSLLAMSLLVLVVREKGRPKE